MINGFHIFCLTLVQRMFGLLVGNCDRPHAQATGRQKTHPVLGGWYAKEYRP
jgi:hypothetical protein